jgi:vitamin B12 transporter
VDTAVNIGSAHIDGVETELTLRPVSWATLQATYTYINPRNADTGSLLLRRPQNTASFDATITPLPKLTIVPEVLYTGIFQDFLVDDGGNATGTQVSSPHGLLVNLTITYDVTPNVQLYANGRNLFYSRFEPINGYQTPGSSFLAGIRVRL